MLHQLFTQNIDCLEREAGVPGELIVEAHGSFASQACIECGGEYPDGKMAEAIAAMAPPRCEREGCGGLVKPRIVFFGEQLPAAFFDNRDKPGEADLCIVMGTSLTVQPFASLPNFVRDGCPRLLINKEQVGSIGARGDDVMLLDDCDEGVRRLAEACGWLEELEALWAETAPKAAAALGREPAKTRDEAVEDEVEKLSKQVDQTLKFAQDQREWLEGHDDEGKAGGVKLSPDPPQPGKQLEAEPSMENVTDNGESKAASPDEIKRDATPKVPTNERSGTLAHVFPHMGKSSSL